MEYLVTASYAAHTVDDPQTYETVVEADSPEDAERAAQIQCWQDNHNDPDDVPEPDEYYLVDVFARPAAPPDELIKYAMRVLAANVDNVNEAMSDDAADWYRARYGEDYDEDTFSLEALRRDR